MTVVELAKQSGRSRTLIYNYIKRLGRVPTVDELRNGCPVGRKSKLKWLGHFHNYLEKHDLGSLKEDLNTILATQQVYTFDALLTIMSDLFGGGYVPNEATTMIKEFIVEFLTTKEERDYEHL